MSQGEILCRRDVVQFRTMKERALTPSRVVLASVGLLTLVSGISNGERKAVTGIARFIEQPADVLTVQLLRAEIQMIEKLMPFSHGVGAPSVSYDAKRKKLVASFIVTEDLTKQPVDDVKLHLMSGWGSAVGSVQTFLPEVKLIDVEAHFTKMVQSSADVTFVPFADVYSTGEIVPVIQFR